MKAANGKANDALSYRELHVKPTAMLAANIEKLGPGSFGIKMKRKADRVSIAASRNPSNGSQSRLEKDPIDRALPKRAALIAGQSSEALGIC